MDRQDAQDKLNCGIHLTGVTTTCSARGFTTRFARGTKTPRRKCFTNYIEGEYPLTKIRETALEGRVEGEENGISANISSFSKYSSKKPWRFFGHGYSHGRNKRHICILCLFKGVWRDFLFWQGYGFRKRHCCHLAYLNQSFQQPPGNNIEAAACRAYI